MWQVNITDPEALDDVRALYAPPDHEVFQLVPPSFAELAQSFYTEMGRPKVTRDNVWDMYLDLLGRFLHYEDLVARQEEWNAILAQQEHQDTIELVEQ